MLNIIITSHTMTRDYSNKKAIKVALRQSFGAGVRSALSLQGSSRTMVLRSQKSDIEAMRGDWERVGWQIRSAATKVKKQQPSLCRNKKA